MKLLRFLIPVLLMAGALSSCKKSSDTPPYAKMQVIFSNEAAGLPVAMDSLKYVNAAGNRYSVGLLKYYITNFTLLRTDSVEKNFRNYDLIDEADPASKTINLDTVKNGDYYAVRFFLGVDYDRNHTGSQDGDLDPSKGMIWTWNTGYIFFKHEGNFVDSIGATRPLAFHYGNDRSLVSVTLPIPKMSVQGVDKKLYIRLNLDSLYGSAARIDFNADNNRMSGATDLFWLSAMSANFSRAFQYVKAE